MMQTTTEGGASAPSRSDHRTMAAIFRHPLANDLAWRDVVALFEAIGRVTHKENGKVVLTVGENHLTVTKPHGDHISGAEVVDLRHFLLLSGCAPASTPTEEAHRTAPDLLVALDHHEAHVYHLDVGARDVSEHAIKPYDPHHFLHHLSHKDQPRERGQRAPEDATFYEQIAQAIAPGGRIVVVGHGAGHSNAAAHLIEHLKTHHHDTFTHVSLVVRADVSDMTPSELLDAGRQELATLVTT